MDVEVGLGFNFWIFLNRSFVVNLGFFFSLAVEILEMSSNVFTSWSVRSNIENSFPIGYPLDGLIIGATFSLLITIRRSFKWKDRECDWDSISYFFDGKVIFFLKESSKFTPFRSSFIYLTEISLEPFSLLSLENYTNDLISYMFSELIIVRETKLSFNSCVF